jgi:hypothetical protein
MNALVGFSISSNLPPDRLESLHVALDHALTQFRHLERKSLHLGDTRLDLWGHTGMAEQVNTLPDGSVCAVIGSPHAPVVWETIQDALLDNRFELPWDGRVILLHISADGNCWRIWNDWLGSIPVFYASIGNGRMASTLEPATVAAAGYAPDDFFLPGLVSLLVNGHFLSDWTLYKGMKVVPPDSAMEWDKNGFRARPLSTVQPSQDRWDASWDDLVDEMHDLSHRAIADVLKLHSAWILPLSSGLDSRLIAAVAAELGTNIHACAWGEAGSTDVIFSQQIAATLAIPWKHIHLQGNFLTHYTPRWAALFGTAMHFHGMYQMAFLDGLESEPSSPILTGYIGDVLSGSSLMQYDTGSMIYKKGWYQHWGIDELKTLLKFPFDQSLPQTAEEVKKQVDLISGSPFQKSLFLELWSRQRLFTSFQSNLTSYWRWIATPFLNRAYARFCMSIPRAVHENRRLLGDVFRRYYGRLAVIPGTYAKDPFIPTGSYLLQRRMAQSLPPALRRGPLRGFGTVELRLDIGSIQATGRAALWPLFEVQDQLTDWLDVQKVEEDYQRIMKSSKDIRPLRRLQSVQALAYRLLTSSTVGIRSGMKEKK